LTMCQSLKCPFSAASLSLFMGLLLLPREYI
jgi:hypothetical protein